MEQFHEQRWITIDTSALAGNVRALKDYFGAETKLMAVVKANAYGHGAMIVAPILRDAGADWFGVTTLNEALDLVRSGIESRRTPILLFAPLTTREQAKVAIENGFHLTVCDETHLAVVESAEPDMTQVCLHLKVDTGMGRLGLNPISALSVAAHRCAWSGAYTHMSRAGDAQLRSAARQLTQFTDFLRACKAKGLNMGVRHCANSAAALRMPDARLDMVRIGTALYGQMPSRFVSPPPGLSAQTFQAHAEVAFVRDLDPGETVGYGSEFAAPKHMRAAVIPIGFADGFAVMPESLCRGLRGLKRILAQRDSSRGPSVTIEGRKALVIGRVAMQMIVVDVSGFDPPVKIGDVAEIPMRRLSAGAMLPRRYL